MPKPANLAVAGLRPEDDLISPVRCQADPRSRARVRANIRHQAEQERRRHGTDTPRLRAPYGRPSYVATSWYGDASIATAQVSGVQSVMRYPAIIRLWETPGRSSSRFSPTTPRSGRPSIQRMRSRTCSRGCVAAPVRAVTSRPSKRRSSAYTSPSATSTPPVEANNDRAPAVSLHSTPSPSPSKAESRPTSSNRARNSYTVLRTDSSRVVGSASLST